VQRTEGRYKFNEASSKIKMTERVRQLIDDVVWSTDDKKIVFDETEKILKEHVAPMIGQWRALVDLRDWASENSKSHKAKASKIDMNVNGSDSNGLLKLYNHHWRIHHRYDCVAVAICARQFDQVQASSY
jgi:hypothetical protein